MRLDLEVSGLIKVRESTLCFGRLSVEGGQGKEGRDD